jgi:hypothetical protein
LWNSENIYLATTRAAIRATYGHGADQFRLIQPPLMLRGLSSSASIVQDLAPARKTGRSRIGPRRERGQAVRIREPFGPSRRSSLHRYGERGVPPLSRLTRGSRGVAGGHRRCRVSGSGRPGPSRRGSCGRPCGHPVPQGHAGLEFAAALLPLWG